MLTVTSLNVNGIRSAAKKGLFAWLARTQPDVLCLQELKCAREQLDEANFHPDGYHGYFFPAERPGYSGVGLYTRREPDEVVYGLGWPEFDAEGRYVEARFGALSVASVYLPSGSSSLERQAMKFLFLDRFMPVLREWMASGRRYILCGDWNIAHKAIDLKNWRGNQKNSGFLPEERAWFDVLFDEVGWVDAFRVLNQAPDQYTWWSNRGQAWAKNVGWRIDYHVVTPNLRDALRSTSIYKDERFADHAPLTMGYDITF
jgi:exodeoxyribonuclease III